MTKSMQLAVEVGLIGVRVTFLNIRWRCFLVKYETLSIGSRQGV